MNLTFVPFGNAKISDKNDPSSLSCQHGDVECSGNSYEQCAIYKNPLPKDYLPFVGCLAGKASQLLKLDKTFEDCATEAGLDYSSIKACHDDADLAWQLQLQYNDLTPSDHQWYVRFNSCLVYLLKSYCCLHWIVFTNTLYPYPQSKFSLSSTLSLQDSLGCC